MSDGKHKCKYHQQQLAFMPNTKFLWSEEMFSVVLSEPDNWKLIMDFELGLSGKGERRAVKYFLTSMPS